MIGHHTTFLFYLILWIYYPAREKLNLYDYKCQHRPKIPKSSSLSSQIQYKAFLQFQNIIVYKKSDQIIYKKVLILTNVCSVLEEFFS